MRRVVALGSCIVGQLAAGCSDDGGAAGDPRSGARLKLAWYVYEGGARELERGWYFDAGLDVRCTATDWSDGRRYCAPSYGDAVYVTATCTRALGRTPVGEDPMAFYATQFYLRGDAKPSRLFRRGAPTSAPTNAWQKRGDGCVAVDVTPDGAWFELVDELATSDLAALQEELPPTSALGIVLDTSDDGLRVPRGLQSDGAPCTTVARGNATQVDCVPIDAVVAPYFRDAACSVAVLATDIAPLPRVAIQYDRATSCTSYFAVGEEVTSRPLYERTGAGCVETAAPGGKRFYAMGPRFDVPVLDRVRGASGRIREIERVSGELRVTDPWLYDDELATDCAHDAEQRCAPVTELDVVAFFADATCSTVLELAEVPSGTCDPPARFARSDTGYRPLVAPHTAAIWVPSTGDTCSMYAPPVPNVAYTVGPAIDLSALARAELQIDP